MSRVFEIVAFNVENELFWKQKKFTTNRYMERLRSEDLLNDVAPNFDVFGTQFKELFQNVEVEDEQLWSIDG